MIFPDSQRVRFGRRPLTEVICQIHASLDGLGAEVPEAFRARLGGAFPGHHAQRYDSAIMQFRVAEDGALVPGESSVGAGSVEHVFLSGDGRSKISLGPGFVACSTQDYQEWADFRAVVQAALTAARELHGATSVHRAGLRYVNVIDRAALGLEGRGWGELLRPSVVGLLAEPALVPTDHRQETRYALGPPSSHMIIRHGLADNEAGSPTYVLDTDCFSLLPMTPEAAMSALEMFHEEAGRFFRWALSRELHDALLPETLHD